MGQTREWGRHGAGWPLMLAQALTKRGLTFGWDRGLCLTQLLPSPTLASAVHVGWDWSTFKAWKGRTSGDPSEAQG